MKSIAKVKQQRRIKNIPPYCDNPMSSDDVKLQQAIKEGKVEITPNRRQRKQIIRQIKH
jgi:hypothetical protein